MADFTQTITNLAQRNAAPKPAGNPAPIFDHIYNLHEDVFSRNKSQQAPFIGRNFNCFFPLIPTVNFPFQLAHKSSKPTLTRMSQTTNKIASVRRMANPGVALIDTEYINFQLEHIATMNLSLHRQQPPVRHARKKRRKNHVTLKDTTPPVTSINGPCSKLQRTNLVETTNFPTCKHSLFGSIASCCKK